jgi:hypothetical protein
VDNLAEVLVFKCKSAFARIPESVRAREAVALSAFLRFPQQTKCLLPASLKESSQFWKKAVYQSGVAVSYLPCALKWEPVIWREYFRRRFLRPIPLPAELDNDGGVFAQQVLEDCRSQRVCPSEKLVKSYLFDPTKQRADQYWLLLLRAARDWLIVHHTLQAMPRRLLGFVHWCVRQPAKRQPQGTRRKSLQPPPLWLKLGGPALTGLSDGSLGYAASGGWRAPACVLYQIGASKEDTGLWCFLSTRLRSVRQFSYLKAQATTALPAVPPGCPTAVAFSRCHCKNVTMSLF